MRPVGFGAIPKLQAWGPYEEKSTISCQAGWRLVLFFRKADKARLALFVGEVRLRLWRQGKLLLGRTETVIASEAKQSRGTSGALRHSGSPRRRAPRDDDASRTQRALGAGNDSGMAPQVIEMAQNGLGDPSARKG
jgi:hypothetical protein